MGELESTKIHTGPMGMYNGPSARTEGIGATAEHIDSVFVGPRGMGVMFDDKAIV